MRFAFDDARDLSFLAKTTTGLRIDPAGVCGSSIAYLAPAQPSPFAVMEPGRRKKPPLKVGQRRLILISHLVPSQDRVEHRDAFGDRRPSINLSI